MNIELAMSDPMVVLLKRPGVRMNRLTADFQLLF